MNASPSRPPASLNREVGELRVRIEAVEDEMRILRADVREIRDARLPNLPREEVRFTLADLNVQPR